MRKLALISTLLAIGSFGCGGSDPLTREPVDPQQPGPTENPNVTKARTELKTVFDLHTTVIARSCSPAGGVCHNGKEYPDLRTAGAMINSLNKPCNSDRFDEPHNIFDGCEPEADELVITGITPEWRTRIASLGLEEFDEGRGTTIRRLKLESAPPQGIDRQAAKIVRGAQQFVNLPANLLIEAGKKEGRILDTFNLDYASVRALAQVKGGDPNGNGTFGAAQPWEVIAPGHTDRSYLLGRITGEVPGTRMPLANHPLSDAEYIALFCWVETMSAEPGAHDAIDYNNCSFAKNPRSYQVIALP